MDQDDKTARALRGAPTVRATPPVGTPLGPQPSPASPPPNAPLPRTVGGHTARLITPDTTPPARPDPGYPPLGGDVGVGHDSLDHLGSSSVPMLEAAWDALSAPPARPAPGSSQAQTVGGTTRLEPVSPEDAAAAKRRFEDEQAAPQTQLRAVDDGGFAPKPPLRAVDDGGFAPKPPLRAAPDATTEPPPTPPAVAEGGSAPKPPLTTVNDGGSAPKPPLRAADDGPSTFSLLLTPASVVVGIVCFAMGSIGTLTVDARIAANRAQSAVSALSPGGPPAAPSAVQGAPGPQHAAPPGSAALPGVAPVSVAPAPLDPPTQPATDARPSTSAAAIKPAGSTGPAGVPSAKAGGGKGVRPIF